MPVKFSLKFMAVVGAYFTNPKWELFNDVINEVDCVCLGVFLIDFERSDPKPKSRFLPLTVTRCIQFFLPSGFTRSRSPIPALSE
jgi:hypothetical protein